jgi:hypothetical protein
MKTIQRFYGVKLGGFVDVYEEQLAVDRETAIKAIAGPFDPRAFGRAYDGAYVVSLSRRRELAFYLQPGLVRIEDRHFFPVSVRLLPDRLRPKIERVACSLRGEPAASADGGIPPESGRGPVARRR